LPHSLRRIIQQIKIIADALPVLCELLGRGGGEELIESGIVEENALFVLFLLAGFQFVAEGYELVYFGDDAKLFLEWGEWN